MHTHFARPGRTSWATRECSLHIEIERESAVLLFSTKNITIIIPRIYIDIDAAGCATHATSAKEKWIHNNQENMITDNVYSPRYRVQVVPSISFFPHECATLTRISIRDVCATCASSLCVPRRRLSSLLCFSVCFLLLLPRSKRT